MADIQFIKGTATVNTGQSTIAIAGSNAQFINVGTAIFVAGAAYPVEAIEGTSTTITLREPWPHANISGAEFVAINTLEGLASALSKLRDYANRLIQASVEQTAFIKLYESTTAGLADTINGEFFNVVELVDTAKYTSLYRNDSGVATLIASMPTIQRINQAESNASQSETNAGISETNAANSATAASTSETNAGNSATAAETARLATEQIFDQFGDQYLGSKALDPTVDNDGDPLNEGDIYWNSTDNVLKFYTGTAWVAPENIATTAATNALASEQAAATSETNSANSASAAATSETNAANSESAAATSETNSANSASAAATSETNTAALYDQFDDRYLGSKAVAPTTDNDGQPLLTGALYFSTADNTLYLYNGTAWQRASTVVEGIYVVDEFTNVSGQTTFTLPYDIGLVQVLYNGVQLAQTDFTANNNTSVVLGTAVADAADVITIIRWGAVTESSFMKEAPVANSGVVRDERGAVKSATAVDGDDAVVLSQLPDGAADLYAKNNILGTVSQSGGVPTGAIIERGSNANGEYVKYADGTLICTEKTNLTNFAITTAWGSIFTSAVLDLGTTPATFISAPVCNIMVTSSSNNAVFTAGIQPATTTSFGTIFALRATSSTLANVEVLTIAIGRWY